MALFSLHPDRELDFVRPFTQIVKQTLTVKNTSTTDAIAFKVKTTAPKQYCVRPNAGRVPPLGAVQVQVLLQAMKEEPPADFKSKDKFLVQCIKISDAVMAMDADASTNTLQELWAQAESAKKSGQEDAIDEKKVKCVFLQPTAASATLMVPGTTSPVSAATPVKSENVASIANRSATTPVSTTVTTPNVPSTTSTAFTSPATATTNTVASTVTAEVPSKPAPKPVSAPSPSAPVVPVSASASTTTTTPASTSTTSNLEKELSETKEAMKRLQATCDSYQKEIERLSALRQRRVGGASSSDDQTEVKSGIVGGLQNQDALKQDAQVPFMMALLFGLMAFLIGAIFF